jgi:hypothetical protein
MKNLNLLEVVLLIRRSLSRIHVYNTWKRNPNVIMQQKERLKKSLSMHIHYTRNWKKVTCQHALNG